MKPWRSRMPHRSGSRRASTALRRRSPGFSSTSRRASLTRTARRAPPPGPGPATRPLAAGRARARPARRWAPSIICRSTCASSHRPSSSERMLLLSLREAIATYVSDGASVALEGFTHLIPFAAAHEIIRQQRRGLHLIRMTPDLVYDQLIGMGCASRLTFSWGGNPGVGSLHRLRDAVEHGWPQPLELAEFTHAEMAVAYTAGASGLPCALLRRHADTDLTMAQGATAQALRCPFTAAALALIPALTPDVTILHAQQIDARGNVLICGIVGAAKEAAMAARRLLVTVEEQVETLKADMNALILPSWVITAASIVPGGAYPSYAQDYYPRDNAFYLEWDEIARDRDTFTAWMKRHVLGVADHAVHLRTLGVVA